MKYAPGGERYRKVLCRVIQKKKSIICGQYHCRLCGELEVLVGFFFF